SGVGDGGVRDARGDRGVGAARRRAGGNGASPGGGGGGGAVLGSGIGRIGEMAAERTLTIVNKLGLHARAAAKLVQTAAKFKCEVKIARVDVGANPGAGEVNAKSIMGVLMLAAAKGTTVKLWASGEDEQAAIDALVHLIEA